MTSEREQLESAILALEAQRETLGEGAVDAAVGGLRQKLADLAVQAPTGQRKLVTILFADVSGFSALSETMDAEDANEALNAVWEQLDAVVQAHEGTIDKHIGSVLMAIWGAEAAREDDPEQATRAGLAIQQALADFVGSRTELSLKLRIGLNTGPVLVGELSTTGEFTAIGDTVNVASRLQDAATPGQMLISQDTYRHVRGVFAVEQQPPMEVRGRSELVQTYLVRAAKPRAFRIGTRGVEGIETHLIGREAELKLLQDTFRAVTDEQSARLLLITGDAGVGKSRLIHEFTIWMELQPDPWWFFQGRAYEPNINQPFSLIRDLLAFRFEVQDNEPAAVAREKFVAGVAQFMGGDSEEAAHLIGQLVGLDFSTSPHVAGILSDPQQLRRRAIRHLAQFFRAVATSGGATVALLVEDTHWADEGSLDLIRTLADECGDVRLVMLCAARSRLFERFPSWGQGLGNLLRVELEPLSKNNCSRLMQDILRKADSVPDALRELIVNRAEGNPFYVEELVKILIEDGVIVPGVDQWRIEPSKLVAVRIPQTLTGVLQARIDNLPPEEKLALQRASVVGREFWDGAVQHLSGGQADIAALLAGLSQRQLIFRQEPSALSGNHEFAFKNAILCDVTYDTVLKRLRGDYHRQTAEWLVAQSGERLREFAGLIADHYEQAGQVELASRYLLQAAEQAMEVCAYREAIDGYERAQKLLRGHDAQRIGVLGRLAEALCRVSDYGRAVKYLQESLNLARTAGDRLAQIQAYYVLGQIDYDQGKFDESIEKHWAGLEIARELGDKKSIARTLYLLGFTYLQIEQLSECRACFDESLALARELNDRHTIAANLSGLGTMATVEEKYDEAVTFFEPALELAREINDRERIVIIVNNLGWTTHLAGDQAKSKAYLEQALADSEEIGANFRNMQVTLNLGHTLTSMGDISGARAAYQYAIYRGQRLGAMGGLLEAVVGLAGLLEAEGDDQDAAEWIGMALSHAASRSDAQQVAKPIQARLAENLPAEDLNAAYERGASLSLATVLRKALGDDPE
jgi:class 3 adenylate cyclase/tetratricopeptide (TPR) repeat protein